MGGDVITAAKAWAKAGLRDPSFAVCLRDAYSAMLRQSIAAGGLDVVTSATKNGVSMTKTIGLKPLEGMEAMGIALDWIALGVVPSTSRALGRF
jgi:predicted dinucleotide-utilizing enzyme